jgi:hypothetical protein
MVTNFHFLLSLPSPFDPFPSAVAHIWFFIAAMGYVTYDIVYGMIPLYCSTSACQDFSARAATYSNFWTVLWAAAYMFDALLYFFALLVHDKAHFVKCPFWSAEVGNVVASALYLVSQALYYYPQFAALDNFDEFKVRQIWLNPSFLRPTLTPVE